MAEQLAVMKNVHIGVGDRGIACMWFDAYISEYVCALQVLSWDEARKVLEDVQASGSSYFEGASCWVETGDHAIKFIRMFKK